MKKIILLLLMSISFFLSYAQRSVSGTVTDASDGSPLSGVTVTINGQPGGTTDALGKYSVSVTGNTSLVFSRVDYSNISLSTGTNATLDVVMQRSQRNLEEVVVTGYTTQTRRQATSSISKISGDNVKSQPLGSFEQMLQGQAPGILVQSQSGQPGSAATVTIRGKGSFLGSTQPLYIVDGIEISAADFASINPSDFDSYNILKDAMGTAQYGSRGANGVIVITTKKGANRKTQLNYDVQLGTAELPKNRLTLMTSAEKIDYELNYDRPDGLNPFEWSPEVADSLSNVKGDLQDVLFRRGVTNQHQLSISGGNDKTRFYASGSVFDQEGIVIKTGLRRVSGRLNLDHTAGNFKVGIKGYVGSSRFTGTNENDQFIGTPLNAIRWTNPYVTAYLPDGSYNLADSIQGQPNPVQELLGTPSSIQQLKLIGALSMEYNFPFAKGLSIRSNMGIDYTGNDNQQYFDKGTYQGSQATGGNGQFSQSTTKNTRQTFTTSLNYSKTAGDHAFNIGLFNEYVDNKFSSFGYTGYGLVGPFKNGVGITPGTSSNGYIPTVTSTPTIEDNLMSYFAIGDYAYRKKYFLSGTVRRDGSSKLAEGNKWTTFGAVGAGWLISSEGFMSNSTLFNELKLKASYGSSASQALAGSYPALEQFSPAVYDGIAGLILTNLRNGALSWEIRRTLNVGVDFALLKNRISGSVEYYDARTNGLFLNRQISGTNGATSIITNLGKLQNQGIEASMNVDVIKGKDFVWSIGGNFTYNKNKILQLDGTNENIDASGTIINRVGQAANSAYLVRYAGVDPANGDALYYTADGKTTTNQYDPNDKVIVGKLDPPYFGGATTSFKYKGIEASVLFTYSFGNKVINADRANVENPGYWYSGLSKEILTEWRNPGDITNIPSPFNDFQTSTTRFLEDGKYLRLKNVMLSYSFPQQILSKTKITSARFFVQGQNLYVWSKFKGYDPEIASGVLTGAQYPALKAFTVGLNLGF